MTSRSPGFEVSDGVGYVTLVPRPLAKYQGGVRLTREEAHALAADLLARDFSIPGLPESVVAAAIALRDACTAAGAELLHVGLGGRKVQYSRDAGGFLVFESTFTLAEYQATHVWADAVKP